MAAAVPDVLLAHKSFEQREEANGEMVEGAVRASQRTEAVKAGLGFVGFAMGVVGLWGDGA